MTAVLDVKRLKRSPDQWAVKKQSGFALPAVAFLIVIVALIIAGLDRISSSQIATNTMSLQSSRAYLAAYSGIEWAAYQVKDSNSCPATGQIGSPLTGVVVELMSCTETLYQEGATADNIRVYEIRVLATFGGRSQYGSNPDFASRELTVSMVVEN
jgi:MSHA biogenesis protein MshP